MSYEKKELGRRIFITTIEVEKNKRVEIFQNHMTCFTNSPLEVKTFFELKKNSGKF